MKAIVLKKNQINLDKTKLILTKKFPHITFYCTYDYNTAIEYLTSNAINFFILSVEYVNIKKAKTDLALGRYIRSIPCYKYTPIIYISDSLNEIHNALHNIKCIDYIIRPYEHTELTQSVSILLDSPFVTYPSIKFKDIYGYYRYINLYTIDYIKSEGRLMHIYCSGKKYTTAQYRLEKLLQLLPYFFIRCHKSYIVNMRSVCSYKKN